MFTGLERCNVGIRGRPDQNTKSEHGTPLLSIRMGSACSRFSSSCSLSLAKVLAIAPNPKPASWPRFILEEILTTRDGLGIVDTTEGMIVANTGDGGIGIATEDTIATGSVMGDTNTSA